MKNLNYRKIHTKLLQANHILLVGHKRPDGDALGAVLAMYEYLVGEGKTVNIFTKDQVPSCYEFLPNSEKVSTDQGILNKNYDVVLFLDCANLERVGIDTEKISAKFTINIDHHPNPLYADINIVDKTTSATCEVIYAFFKANNIAINRVMASCLLTGIIDDTGGFAHGVISANTMAITSELLDCGVKMIEVVNNLLRNRTMEALKIWGLALSRLKKNEELNLAYTYIDEKDLADHGVNEEATENIANFLNNLGDAEATLVLKINAQGVRGSFRTTGNKIDVSKLAGVFDGGGGHKQSAGFTTDKTLEEVKTLLKLS